MYSVQRRLRWRPDAVHLPLTAEAQAECRFMLLSPNNLLKPSDGGLVAVPSQDMILGVYYLTMRKLADYKDDPKMVAQVSSDTVYNDVDELRKLTTPDENTGKAELGLYDLIWFEDVTDGNRRCALQTDRSSRPLLWKC